MLLLAEFDALRRQSLIEICLSLPEDFKDFNQFHSLSPSFFTRLFTRLGNKQPRRLTCSLMPTSNHGKTREDRQLDSPSSSLPERSNNCTASTNRNPSLTS